jgi:prophage regulatory protein
VPDVNGNAWFRSRNKDYVAVGPHRTAEGSLQVSHHVESPTLIPYHDLKAKGVSYSKPHLWRLERDGKLPMRVPTGPTRYAYAESEIDAYQTALIAARDAAPQNRSWLPQMLLPRPFLGGKSSHENAQEVPVVAG